MNRHSTACRYACSLSFGGQDHNRVLAGFNGCICICWPDLHFCCGEWGSLYPDRNAGSSAATARITLQVSLHLGEKHNVCAGLTAGLDLVEEIDKG